MAGPLEVAGRGRPLFRVTDGPARDSGRYAVLRFAGSMLEPSRQRRHVLFCRNQSSSCACGTEVTLNYQLSMVNLEV
jgi:hypothetical protein